MTHTSSTREIPAVGSVPRHVAVIMDGNGRWAKRRLLPRVAGHKRGVEALQAVTRACVDRGIAYLTVFAFSSENWRRPAEEVSFLRQLLLNALQNEVARLHENGICLKVIGEIGAFGTQICDLVAQGEALTAKNRRLTLTIAVNYGGRWDLLQAIDKMLAQQPEQRSGFREEQLASCLAMNYAPEPDLFIRTGGEQRISNFLLWQLAYTELYFTPTLWPDFGASELDVAIQWYADRERRFGRTSEQLQEAPAPAEHAHKGARKLR